MRILDAINNIREGQIIRDDDDNTIAFWDWGGQLTGSSTILINEWDEEVVIEDLPATKKIRVSSGVSRDITFCVGGSCPKRWNCKRYLGNYNTEEWGAISMMSNAGWVTSGEGYCQYFIKI